MMDLFKGLTLTQKILIALAAALTAVIVAYYAGQIVGTDLAHREQAALATA